MENRIALDEENALFDSAVTLHDHEKTAGLSSELNNDTLEHANKSQKQIWLEPCSLRDGLLDQHQRD